MSVWGEEENLGFLRASAMNEAQEVLDLSDESAFRQFMEGFLDSWDADFAWYRWSTLRSLSGLAGALTPPQEAAVGEVEAVAVTERYDCGAVKELTVTGTDGSTVIEGADAIRAYLGSPDTIILKDGSSHDGTSLLPSAFFYLEETEGGYRIRGGGFGHGVGMSQDGAQGMAGRGHNYLEILSYYYQNIGICQIY